MLRIFFSVLIALLVLSAIFITFIVDQAPAAGIKWSLTAQDIQRAKDILKNQVYTGEAETRALLLTQKDINLAANHLLNRELKSTTNIEILAPDLDFIITLEIPDNLFGNYINIHFRLININSSPRLKNLTIGQIPVPQPLADLAFKKLINHPRLEKYRALADQHIENVEVESDQLNINYTLSAGTLRQIRSMLADRSNIDTLKIYQKKLLEVVAIHDPDWRLSLAELLKQLFQLAYERSSLENAVKENRSVIFVVNAYVNDQKLEEFSSKALPVFPGPRLPVFLYKRIDMSKHFMGSAAITASGSGFLANMLGLDKEIRDSQKGSGFSFIDLAADRAGMYFGEIATSNPENARKIQHAMSDIIDYTAFMPDVRDLPENIEANDLILKYQSFESEASRKILKQVDDRIAASLIYKDI